MFLIKSSNELIEVPRDFELNGVMYPYQIFYDKELLNNLGIVELQEGFKPNCLLYDYTVNIVNDRIEYVKVPKNLDYVKDSLLQKYSIYFKQTNERPKIPTSLGFSVDGSMNDLLNFQIGKELQLPIIKDSEGIEHSVVLSDYDIILLEIKVYGINQYKNKWDFENTIKNICNSAEEIEQFLINSNLNFNCGSM